MNDEQEYSYLNFLSLLGFFMALGIKFYACETIAPILIE